MARNVRCGQLEVLDQTMKTTFHTARWAALAAGLLMSVSAVHSQDNSKIPSRDRKETKTMTGYVGPIEKQTMENEYFRQVLFTGPHSQLVAVSYTHLRAHETDSYLVC